MTSSTPVHTYTHGHSPLIHVHTKFNDNIFICLSVMKNVLISVIREYRRQILMSPRDVIDDVDTLKTFSGITFDLMSNNILNILTFSK